MVERKELEKLNEWDRLDVAGLPDGPLGEDVPLLDSFHDDYRKVMEPAERGGESVLLGPTVQFESRRPNYDGQGGEYFKGEGYLLYPARVKKGHLHKMHLFYRNRFDKDDVHRIQIDLDSGEGADIDKEESFEDSNLVKALLRASEQEIAPKKRARQNRFRNIRNTILGLGLVGTLAAGAYAAVEEFIFLPNQAAHRRELAMRRAFDRSGYVLPGNPTVSGTENVSLLPVTQFNRIPKDQSGDNLINARRFSVGENSCKLFGVSYQPGEKIVLDQSSANSYQTNPFAYGFDSNGKLFVCSLKDTGDNNNVSFNLALQIDR